MSRIVHLGLGAIVVGFVHFVTRLGGLRDMCVGL